MKKEILEERLKELDLSVYGVAQKVAQLRSADTGEEQNVQNLYSAIRQAIKNPERSTLKTLLNIIEALDGELIIRWKQKEEIITGEREVVVD